MVLTTRLCHSSGQWIEETMSIPVAKVDAQGAVGAITYARRAALAAFVGIAPTDDDDGETAVGREASKDAPGSTPEKKRYPTVRVPEDPVAAAKQQFWAYLKSPEVIKKLEDQGWNMTALGQTGDVGKMAATNLMTKLLGRPLSNPITESEFRICSEALVNLRDGAAQLKDYGVKP
jgi:hypothetical protein